MPQGILRQQSKPGDRAPSGLVAGWPAPGSEAAVPQLLPSSRAIAHRPGKVHRGASLLPPTSGLRIWAPKPQ